MLNKETIQKYFDKGLWTVEMVANAVVKGRLTAQEYEAITGQGYGG